MLLQEGGDSVAPFFPPVAAGVPYHRPGPLSLTRRRHPALAYVYQESGKSQLPIMHCAAGGLAGGGGGVHNNLLLFGLMNVVFEGLPLPSCIYALKRAKINLFWLVFGAFLGYIQLLYKEGFLYYDAYRDAK